MASGAESVAASDAENRGFFSTDRKWKREARKKRMKSWKREDLLRREDDGRRRRGRRCRECREKRKTTDREREIRFGPSLGEG